MYQPFQPPLLMIDTICVVAHVAYKASEWNSHWKIPPDGTVNPVADVTPGPPTNTVFGPGLYNVPADGYEMCDVVASIATTVGDAGTVGLSV